MPDLLTTTIDVIALFPRCTVCGHTLSRDGAGAVLDTSRAQRAKHSRCHPDLTPTDPPMSSLTIRATPPC